jgi:hypothetical protein
MRTVEWVLGIPVAGGDHDGSVGYGKVHVRRGVHAHAVDDLGLLLLLLDDVEDELDHLEHGLLHDVARVVLVGVVLGQEVDVESAGVLAVRHSLVFE